jgi:hypothetical protein
MRNYSNTSKAIIFVLLHLWKESQAMGLSRSWFIVLDVWCAVVMVIIRYDKWGECNDHGTSLSRGITAEILNTVGCWTTRRKWKCEGDYMYCRWCKGENIQPYGEDNGMRQCWGSEGGTLIGECTPNGRRILGDNEADNIKEPSCIREAEKVWWPEY